MKPTVWSASSRHARLCTVLTALRHWEGRERKDGVSQGSDTPALPSCREDRFWAHKLKWQYNRWFGVPTTGSV